MNHVEIIEKTTECHPISNFFQVNQLSESPEKVILTLSFLSASKPLSDRPTSILGLIFDSAASLVGQHSIGNCIPVEQEVFVHADVFPEKIKAIATIELVCDEHALFYCEIFSVGGTQELLAVSHGTLKKSA